MSRVSHDFSQVGPSSLIRCIRTFQKVFPVLFSSAQLRQHVRHAHPSAEERAVRSGGGGSVFCPVCKEEGIGGKMALKMHLFEKHGMGEAFRCEGCNFQTPSKPAFTKHACHKTDRKVLKVCPYDLARSSHNAPSNHFSANTAIRNSRAELAWNSTPKSILVAKVCTG